MANFDPSNAVPVDESPGLGEQLGRYAGIVNKKLAPMTAAAGIGAGLGLAGGPFAEVTSPAGAVGGLASYGVAHLLDLPAAAYNNLKPQSWPASPYPGQGFDDAVNGLAKRAGLNYGQDIQPNSPSERIFQSTVNAVGDAGAGYGLGSTLKNFASPAVQAVGQAFAPEKAVPNLIASGISGAAAGTAHELAPNSQLAPVVAGLLAPAALPLGPNAVRYAFRGNDPEKVQNTINLFNDVNTTPSVGQATGNGLVKGLEGVFGKMPFAGSVMDKLGENQSQGIQTRLFEAADSLDPNATATSAGRKAAQGITETFIPAKREVQGQLYDKLNSLIGSDTPVDTTNFGQALAKLTKPVAGANELAGAKLLSAHPDIQDLSNLYNQALENGNGQLSFGALKDIRSRIGEKLGDFSLSSDKPTAQLKQLYGALSGDMQNAANAAGPEAQAAYNRANTYTRALNDRIDILQNAIDKAGGPEKIFEAATAPNTNKFGATTLGALMKSLPDDAKQTFASAFIRNRLGRPNDSIQNSAGDAFSTQTFLTNWSRMSPEAKQAMFSSLGDDFVNNMDKLAQVASVKRESAGALSNPSGTAQAVAKVGAPMAALGSLAAGNTKAALGFTVPLALGYVGARAFTSPGFVKFLANSSSLPTGNILPQIDRLTEIAKQKGDQDGADAFAKLKEGIQNGFNPSTAQPVFDPASAVPVEEPTRAQKLLTE